jgi:hypothetical protein
MSAATMDEKSGTMTLGIPPPSCEKDSTRYDWLFDARQRRRA